MTAPLMRGSDIHGHPVVDSTTGEDVAEIRDVIFDPAHGTISGFTLNKRGGLFAGRMKDILPVDGVFSVGTDAVMILGLDALTPRSDAPEEMKAASDDDDVLNDIVVTESGRVLGKVRDVVLMGGPQPRVVGFEIGDGAVGSGLIPISHQQGVSGSALIVPDEYERRVRTDLTGLSAELNDIEASRS